MQVALSQILRVPPDTAQSAGSRDSQAAQARQSASRTETPEAAAIPAPAPQPSPASVVLKIQAPGTDNAARSDGLTYSNKGLIARAREGMDLGLAEASGATQMAPDFVSHAVSAMRQFTDDADRRKRYALQDATPPAATAGSLSGLKKLSARFSLFA